MADDPDIILEVAFFRTSAGAEPVREWLKPLPPTARKAIGEDIKTVQFGWPLGMPLVRKLDAHLWVDKTMVLLHGFVKKSQKTPIAELKTARARLRRLRFPDQQE